MKKVRLWFKVQAPIFGDVSMGFGISALAGEYNPLMRGEVTPVSIIVVLSAIMFVTLGATLRQKGGRNGRS